MSTMTEGGSDVEEVKLLSGNDDKYEGVVVEMNESMAMDSTAFVSSLRASMSQWKLQGKKGVWIKLPIKLVNLAEAAVKEGFWFHHAERKYLMLVYWIPQTANTIPAYATHRVGIGAFVINDKQEVLVVQEKSGKFAGTDAWKIPTGVVDQGEDICDAAVREVKEETGIDAEFVEVLAFRQSHKSYFDKSDLFFVCMLRPITVDIQKQDLEIEAAQWMPFDKYAAQPIQQKIGFQFINNICSAKIDGRFSGFSPVHLTSANNYVYSNNQDLTRE